MPAAHSSLFANLIVTMQPLTFLGHFDMLLPYQSVLQSSHSETARVLKLLQNKATLSNVIVDRLIE